MSILYPFLGSHTAESIGKSLLALLAEWKIPKERVHAIVSDNGANVKAGLRQAELPGIPCSIHTLQLVVELGLKAQRVIIDTVARLRKISGHFRHSALANERLHKMQISYNCPEHKMVQDVATRWDSTYNMISRAVEQKKSLVGYDSEFGLPERLSSNEWTIAEKLLVLLEPFQRTTKELSRNCSSLSQVIPFIEILKISLNDHTEDRGVQQAKEVMLESLTKRFEHVYSNKHFYIATLLDPRFKQTFFDQTTVDLATDEILILSAKVRVEPMESTAGCENAEDDVTNQDVTGFADDERQEEGESSSKRKKFDMWSTLSKVIADKKALQQPKDLEESVAKLELKKYLEEDVNDAVMMPLEFWTKNKERFPSICPIAYRFLSCPPSSVASESLFSTTGNIDSDKRRCLQTERIEMLAFLKRNANLI